MLMENKNVSHIFDTKSFNHLFTCTVLCYSQSISGRSYKATPSRMITSDDIGEEVLFAKFYVILSYLFQHQLL
jgi:hypothetical protein